MAYFNHKNVKPLYPSTKVFKPNNTYSSNVNHGITSKANNNSSSSSFIATSSSQENDYTSSYIHKTINGIQLGNTKLDSSVSMNNIKTIYKQLQQLAKQIEKEEQEQANKINTMTYKEKSQLMFASKDIYQSGTRESKEDYRNDSSSSSTNLHESPLIDAQYFSQKHIKNHFLQILNSPETSKEVLLSKLVKTRNMINYLFKNINFNIMGSEVFQEDEQSSIIPGLPKKFLEQFASFSAFHNESNPGYYKKAPLLTLSVSNSYGNEEVLLATEQLTSESLNKKLYSSYNSLLYQFSFLLNKAIGNLSESEKIIEEANSVTEPLNILNRLAPVPEVSAFMQYSALNATKMNEQLTLMSSNICVIDELVNTLAILTSNGYTNINLPCTPYPTLDNLPFVNTVYQIINNYNTGTIQYYSLLINVILCFIEQLSVNSSPVSDELYGEIKTKLSYYVSKVYSLYATSYYKSNAGIIQKTFSSCSCEDIYISTSFISSNNQFALVEKDSSIFFQSASVQLRNTSYIGSSNYGGYTSSGTISFPSGTYLSTATCIEGYTVVSTTPNFNYYQVIKQAILSGINTSSLDVDSVQSFGEPSDPSQVSSTVNFPKSAPMSPIIPITTIGATKFNIVPFNGVSLDSELAVIVNPTPPSIVYEITDDIIIRPSSSGFSTYPMEGEVSYATSTSSEILNSQSETKEKFIPNEVLFEDLSTLQSQILSMANNMILTNQNFLVVENKNLNPIYLALQAMYNTMEFTSEPIFEELAYQSTISHNVKFSNLNELMDCVYAYIEENPNMKPDNYYKKDSRTKYVQSKLGILNSCSSSISTGMYNTSSDASSVKLCLKLNLGGGHSVYSYKELLDAPKYNLISYEFAKLLSASNLLFPSLHPTTKLYINRIIQSIEGEFNSRV